MVASLEVPASQRSLLDAWVDFDGNDSWADDGERIFASEPLAAGTGSLTLRLPRS
ncbi:MAG: hypothetical protein MI919_30565 [Holophagales bacterium]|nr:hypothetical protein [Holophagales bacterium]